MTDSGVIAARLGGCVEATKSWLMPGYEIPTMPTRCSRTHGWAAIVSIASYPSSSWASSKYRNDPPLHPLPRMFTPT